MLKLLRLSFKKAGFSIATATNGIEALKKARSLSPDLIVLDLILPEMDGFAVCETLRKTPATKQIPVVVLTGLTSEFTRLAGLEAGATEFVNKPINPQYLISRIEALLKSAQESGRASDAVGGELVEAAAEKAGV